LGVIEITEICKCRDCGSDNLVKNGHDYKGSQKFECKACGFQGTLELVQGYSLERKLEIMRAYQERQSMRGIERTFGVMRKTLARWLLEFSNVIPPLKDTLLEAQPDDVLELDELWSFVFRKDNKRWVWIALCRRTRQVVSFYIGDRSEMSCRELWKRIPENYKACKTFSDFWEAYDNVFEKNTSTGKNEGETCHVERWNNTLRQRLGRFVRKTLSFSKSDVFHSITLGLFVVAYNLSLVS
jgi:IS1 family transposase/transposase-like protein